MFLRRIGLQHFIHQIPAVIHQMSAVGGLLIVGIGFNLLEIKKIRIGNMLPAIFLPLLYYWLKLSFTA